MLFVSSIIEWRQNFINKINRRRLKNLNPTLICSNCTGGVIYHWLGLQFNSPFINLYMDNNDFIFAMENFESFINQDIVEDFASDNCYPVGIGYGGVKVHFMHYKSFSEANSKWNERKKE